jgi:hypothetical protein
MFKDGTGKKWALFERFVIPDIAEPDKDYLIRWRLLQTPWFGIFLHKILMIDNDINLHDHPWSFYTFILSGGYIENVHVFEPVAYSANNGEPHSWRGQFAQRKWTAGSLHKMRAGVQRYQSDLHKITYLLDKPTWSLLFVGPRIRDWGYQTKDGWVARKDYDWRKYNNEITIEPAFIESPPSNLDGANLFYIEEIDKLEIPGTEIINIKSWPLGIYDSFFKVEDFLSATTNDTNELDMDAPWFYRVWTIPLNIYEESCFYASYNMFGECVSTTDCSAYPEYFNIPKPQVQPQTMFTESVLSYPNLYSGIPGALLPTTTINYTNGT